MPQEWLWEPILGVTLLLPQYVAGTLARRFWLLARPHLIYKGKQMVFITPPPPLTHQRTQILADRRIAVFAHIKRDKIHQRPIERDVHAGDGHGSALAALQPERNIRTLMQHADHFDGGIAFNVEHGIGKAV